MKETVAHPDNILIFKTNISSPIDSLCVKKAFDKEEHIIEWSVDLEDCDKVLRVVSEKLNTLQLIEKITGLGFDCAELE